LGFDLDGDDTYHTRPMSEDWSKLRDIDLLADGHASFEFVIPLAEFPRLTPQLSRPEGVARGVVRFAREGGVPVAHVKVNAPVVLTCQRCLGPIDLPVDCEGPVAMVADGASADAAPAGLETILAPERRLSVRDLVEEELLLALPIVALHEPGRCARGATIGSAPPPEPATADRHRPFEQLGELLKRDRH